MKDKKSFTAGMNVGSSSILVTFVLLCLVTFAALSFVSAKADNTLTKQTSKRISAYYEADTNAKEHLVNISSILDELSNEYSEEEYFENVENTFSNSDIYNIVRNENDTFIHYEVPISDSQDLLVTLKVLYPLNSSNDTFSITEWETVTTYVPEPEPIIGEKGNFLF